MAVLVQSNFAYPSSVLNPTVLQAEGWTSLVSFDPDPVFDSSRTLVRGLRSLKFTYPVGGFGVSLLNYHYTAAVERSQYRCYVYIPAGLQVTQGGSITDWCLTYFQQSGGESAIGLGSQAAGTNVADQWQIRRHIGAAVTTKTYNDNYLTGRWHCIEQQITVPTGGTGTSKAWIDGHLRDDYSESVDGDKKISDFYVSIITPNAPGDQSIWYGEVVLQDHLSTIGPIWYPRGNRETRGWGRRSFAKTGMSVLAS